MRIIIDILHPAHVHFFRNPIQLMCEAGHEVLVTSRDKDCTLQLLDEFGIPHRCLSRHGGGGLIRLASELIARDLSLARVARRFRPNVLAGIGGVCAAHVGRALGVRSVAFYDTENATLQNAMTYPFASCVVVPDCYQGWTPRRRTRRYPGYHELSYLHPSRFAPNRDIAVAGGLASDGDTFLVRVVSWQASHDVGLRGWSTELLDAVIDMLTSRGKTIISAEGPLPRHLDGLRYSGTPAQLHHLLAYCRLQVGESATLASEAAVLGVPSVYVASVSRGYVDEQADKYGMTELVPTKSRDAVAAAVSRMLTLPRDVVAERHGRLISSSVDVAQMVTEILTERRIA